MASSSVQRFIQNLLQDATGIHISSCRFTPVGGGSINDTWQVLVNEQTRFFVKLNNAVTYPDMFAAEKKGLELMATQQVIRVPQVIATGITEGQQVLVLEWIEQGVKTVASWTRLGQQLAALHKVTAEAFGLDIDNYMGALPQYNALASDWCTFFEQQRLVPQIRLARDKQLLTPQQVSYFERLYRHLPDIFPPEPAALLHGDLWSGNYLCDAQEQPVLIDPAVYYGHRSVDLAMTTLFGGFDPLFYEAYHYHFPLPGNYRQQCEICNLYPLLVHLNLFGESYLPDILRTIQHY